jgi:hypothetical protein
MHGVQRRCPLTTTPWPAPRCCNFHMSLTPYRWQQVCLTAHPVRPPLAPAHLRRQQQQQQQVQAGRQTRYWCGVTQPLRSTSTCCCCCCRCCVHHANSKPRVHAPAAILLKGQQSCTPRQTAEAQPTNGPLSATAPSLQPAAEGSRPVATPHVAHTHEQLLVVQACQGRRATGVRRGHSGRNTQLTHQSHQKGVVSHRQRPMMRDGLCALQHT